MTSELTYHDLENGYHVKAITFEEYLEACARLEDQIFGDYFGFNLANALDETERKKLEMWTNEVPRLSWSHLL